MDSSQNKMINKYMKKGFISNKMHVKTISNWKKMLVTTLCTRAHVASGGTFGTNWYEKPLPEHANSNNAPEGNRYRFHKDFSVRVFITIFLLIVNIGNRGNTYQTGIWLIQC